MDAKSTLTEKEKRDKKKKKMVKSNKLVMFGINLVEEDAVIIPCQTKH